MKKLLAGFLTLSLALAACSNGSDDGSKMMIAQRISNQQTISQKDSKSDDKKSNDSSDKDSNKDSDKDSNKDGNSDSDSDKMEALLVQIVQVMTLIVNQGQCFKQ